MDKKHDGKSGDASLEELWESLFDANQKAFEQQWFNVAYHALAAAYHAALLLRDEGKLHQVERTCKDQLAWIDAHDPGYEHSTVAAKSRGHHSVFQTLATQASVREGMLGHERQHPNLTWGEQSSSK